MKTTTTSIRRYDLDWIRVIVFGLLILYHVGMFFVPWDFHIKNETIADWLVWPMSFLNRWRLPILFLISGMGTRMALSSRSPREFLGERTVRLFIPLVFGILVVVPPQVYVERQVAGAGYESYWQFYPHFFEGIYPSGNFSWHHLWFLPYLLVYSIFLSPLLIYLRNHPDNSFLVTVQRWMVDGRIWIAMAVPLVLAEYALRPYFPATRNLVWDWYHFAQYLLMFVYGFIFISVHKVFWNTLDRIGIKALAIGMVTFTLLVLSRFLPMSLQGAQLVGPLLEAVNTGAWCLAILAMGSRYLNRPSSVLAYCNSAVYPCYIAHQTILIIAAYWTYDLQWPVMIKFLLLSAITLMGSLLTFEIVRRIPLLSICFGIRAHQ
ncbi:MAG: acyltransferase family protein [Pirellulaceae bacterium]|nr:acyltransferase family protein [Pirellulaceae bacterium]